MTLKRLPEPFSNNNDDDHNKKTTNILHKSDLKYMQTCYDFFGKSGKYIFNILLFLLPSYQHFSWPCAFCYQHWTHWQLAPIVERWYLIHSSPTWKILNALRFPKDPPMEGALNLYDTGVRVLKVTIFEGSGFLACVKLGAKTTWSITNVASLKLRFVRHCSPRKQVPKQIPRNGGESHDKLWKHVVPNIA